jgi:hypothetical protein
MNNSLVCNTRYQLIRVMGVLFLLTGCGGMPVYQEPLQSKNDVAVVQSESWLGTLFGVYPYLSEVDDHAVESLSRPSFTTLTLSPGEHKLDFQAYATPVPGVNPLTLQAIDQPGDIGKSITFTAEAGHVYRIESKKGVYVNRQTGEDLIWIRDLTAQQVVAAADHGPVENAADIPQIAHAPLKSLEDKHHAEKL